MCPICWATALASFTGLSAAGLIVVAGRDRYVLMFALFAVALSLGQRWNYFLLPWWLFAGLAVALVCRLTWLIARRPAELRRNSLWEQARRLAVKSCPGRPGK